MDLPDSCLNTLAGLCQENTEGRIHTLLYIKTSTSSSTTSTTPTTGHVDLAERVSKTFWKDAIIRADWLLPTPLDLTYTRRAHVNYCSSTFWDVNIKDSVVKLRHIRSGLEVLVGSTIKKKWSKIKNRILKMNTETTEDYCWVPLIDEKTISITCLNIKMQSER